VSVFFYRKEMGMCSLNGMPEGVLKIGSILNLLLREGGVPAGGGGR